MADLMSIEEVLSLTVPKLKAELTRLNQPLSGLKRKAQLVEALTVSITSLLLLLLLCVLPPVTRVFLKLVDRSKQNAPTLWRGESHRATSYV